MSSALDNLRGENGEERGQRVAIVLVGEEEAFIDLFQHFPPRRYPLIFARDLGEALEFCEAQRPPLLILPLAAASDESQLLRALRRLRALEVRVIGLTREQLPSEPLAKLFTCVHDASDTPALLRSTAALLGERRAAPRASMEVELSLAGHGKAMATVISGRSLFVPGVLSVRTGQLVQLRIEASHARLQCWASVVRVDAGEAKGSGAVLGIAEKDRDVRAYLEGLVRGVLLLEHAELANVDPKAALPQNMGHRLVERLTQQISTLRTRLESQVALTEALTARLDAIAAAEAKTVKWKDVRPVLVEKWSAQRELIKKLVAKVDAVVTDQRAAERLQETLAREHELEERLEEQASMIDALQRRVNELQGASEEPHDLLVAQEVRSQLDGRLKDQTRVINELSARIELLALRGTHNSEVDRLRKALEDQSVQLASLSLRLDDICDQIRVGEVDHDALARLRADVEWRQQGVRALRMPVDRLEGAAYEEDIPTAQRPESYASHLFLLDAGGGPRAGPPSPAHDEAPDDEITETTGEPSLSDLGPQLVFPESLAASAGAPRDARAGRSSALGRSGRDEEADSAVRAGTSGVDSYLREIEARVPRADFAPAEPERATLPGAASRELAPRLGPRPSGGSALVRHSWWIYATVAVAGVAAGVLSFLAIRSGAVGDPVNGPFAEPIELAPEPSGAAIVPIAVVSGGGPDAALGAADAGAADRALDGAAEPDGALAGVDAHGETDGQAHRTAEAAAPGRSIRAIASRSARSRSSRARDARKAQLKRARRLLREGDYARARQVLTLALKLADEPRVRRLLARAHQLAGEPWPAIHHLRRSLELAPGGASAQQHTLLGLLYLQVAQPRKACESFDAALATRPDYDPALRQRAKNCPQ